MKKIFVLAAVAMMIAGCSSDDTLNMEQTVDNTQTERVTVTFAPYTMETMTRASQTAIGSVVTRLDVWVVEGDSATALTKTAVSEAHQQKGDTGFGSLTLSLDKHKIYTLYAIGHKESAPATFSQGIVTLPDTKKLTTLYYQTTFTPAETTTLDCRMQRAVGMFRVTMTDAVPDSVKKVAVAVNGTPTEWSFPQQDGITTGGEYRVEWTSFKSESNGTTMFSIYILGGDTQKDYDITVSAYDATGAIYTEHLFPSVPVRKGYRTTYRGRFFTDTAFAPTFTIDGDWQDTTVEF